MAHWGSKDKAVQRRRDRRATINREQGRGGQKDRGGEGGKGEEREKGRGGGERHPVLVKNLLVVVLL